MRRLSNKTKPLSVLEAKQEADRYLNLAESTQTRIDNLLKEERKLEDEIKNLCLEKDGLISDFLEEEKKISAIKQNRVDLDKERGVVFNNIEELKTVQNELQKDITNLENTIKESVKEETRRTLNEVEKFNLLIEEQNKKLEENRLDNSKLIVENNELEEKISLVKNLLVSLENEYQEKDKEKIKLNTEIIRLKARIDELKVIASITDEKERFLKTLESDIELTQSSLCKLIEEVSNKSDEFNAFEEKMNNKTAAFKKLEEGIDKKTLRLKNLLDEKGIEKYLLENEIK